MSGDIFAGILGGGVWRSSGKTGAWNQESLVDVEVRGFDIGADGTVYAATNGKGVYRRVASPPTVVQSVFAPVPLSFSLEQNYPNPFNPVTTIVFNLPERGMVSVKVFDLVGREITTLVHEECPAGQYSVLFDGSGLATGIYFYRIQFNRQSAVKRLVLLK
jgi:hypothetical protein